MGLFGDKRKKFVLDTSILVDGRLMIMYRNDLLDGRIITPAFVLDELQGLADSSNYVSEKKGKKGFASLNKLKEAIAKANGKLEVPLCKEVTSPAVDDKLIELCGSMKAVLVTVDGNLTHKAGLLGVKVLNPNVLVGQLRRSVSVGDKYVLRLSEAGKQAGQAIGYLPDSTLVVVDNGDRYIGKAVSVVVRNVIVTDTGIIVFADITWERR